MSLKTLVNDVRFSTLSPGDQRKAVQSVEPRAAQLGEEDYGKFVSSLRVSQPAITQPAQAPAQVQSAASRVLNLTKSAATLPISFPRVQFNTAQNILKTGIEADKNYPAENLLPAAGAIAGGLVGGAATLPSGAGVPFGATVGATEGGAIGETAKNYIRALRGKQTPETAGESLMESAKAGGVAGVSELGGAAIVSGLKTVFSGLPRVLMNKVLGVSKKRLQAEALDKTEEIGAAAANEWKNFGRSSSEILDRIKGETKTIGKKIESAIQNTFSRTKATVDTGQFFDDAINPIIKKLEPNPANKEIIEGIKGLKIKYLDQYGKDITLPQLEKLKISLYDDVSDSSWWKANETLPDKVKSTVALARTARRKISQMVPEISGLNSQYGLYSSMKAFLAGTEAGGGKSVVKLFLEPGYEKALTGASVLLKKSGELVKPFNPVIRPGFQIGANTLRAIPGINIPDDQQ